MRRAPWTTVCALWLALAARAEPADPYDVPRDQFREQVAHIALRPLNLPPGTPEPERLRAEFERLFTAELERRGYVVTPASEFTATWKGFSHDLGGVYDGVTGAVDEAKFDTVWGHTMREMELRRGVDAVLLSGIVHDLILQGADGPFPRYTTAVGEAVMVNGEEKFWGRLNEPLRIDGPFLNVMIRDRANVLLYSLRVPIRWARVFVDGGYFERPIAEVYGDAERNRRSVEILMEQLESR